MIPSLPEPVRLNEKGIGITYRSTLENNRRVDRCCLRHNPVNWVVAVALPLMGATLLSACYVGTQGFVTRLGVIAVLWGLLAVGWQLVLRITVHGFYKARFPTPDTLRICTTRLTREGLVDETPNGRAAVGWKKLAFVRIHEGDIHFWTIFGQGWFVPKEAFQSGEAGQRYYEAALAFFRSDGREWDNVAANWQADQGS